MLEVLFARDFSAPASVSHHVGLLCLVHVTFKCLDVPVRTLSPYAWPCRLALYSMPMGDMVRYFDATSWTFVLCVYCTQFATCLCGCHLISV